MTHSGEYTAADFKNGMPPRAFGSETEYTNDSNVEEKYAVFQNVESPWISKPPALTEFVDPSYLVSSGFDHTNSATIKTGASLYVDNEALEYASPECRTPKELVVHERAGEKIARETIQRMALADGISSVNVYKRSGYATVSKYGKTIIQEESIGHHENYTSLNEFSTYSEDTRNNRLERSAKAKCFADYLALRKLIDGVGMVDVNHFSLTQKPRAINYRIFGHQIEHGVKRPFYQHDDRLEVRSGEGNKSDWATEFKFGLTSLVLRLIEHDKFPRRLRLRDPNQAVIDLARNPLSFVEMQSGVIRKGADVLKEIVEAATELGQSSPDFPKYEQKAVTDFHQFYDDLHLVSLQDHEVSALSDRIDWAARFEYLIDRGATYDTITTNDLNQVRDDLKWDMLDDRDIARRHFSKFGHTAMKAIVPPPPHTRAETRVKIAGELSDTYDVWSVFWDEIISVTGKRYHLGGPLDLGVTLSESNTERPTKPH